MKEKKQTCSNCLHSIYLEKGSKAFYYCNKHYSKRTDNGKLKVKARQEACFAYKNCEE